MTFGLTKRTRPQLQFLKINKQQYNGHTSKCNSKKGREPFLKYLRTFIDEALTWKHQIEYTTTKIRKLVYKFYQLCGILSLEMLKTVYFSLVESIVSYGIVIYISAQIYIIKIMLFRNKRFLTQLFYQECNLLTVE
nr:unnamed protein product [Callosobruchus chinensis]